MVGLQETWPHTTIHSGKSEFTIGFASEFVIDFDLRRRLGF
jgi:hypothetical protein